jgi:citrate synthase
VRTTAPKHSNRSSSNGLEGEIHYRGYSIQDIVGKKIFTEISHLLIWGKWPTPEEKDKFQQKLNSVPLPDGSVFQVIRSFP